MGKKILSSSLAIVMVLIGACTPAALTTSTSPPTTTTASPTTTTEPPTTTTPPEGPILKSLGFSETPDSNLTFLHIVIMPRDESGQLLSVNGNLSVKIWDEIPGNNSDAIPIQQWDNIPVTEYNFTDDVGNDITLEYNEFVPEWENQDYIMLTLTVGAISVTTGRIIYLIPPE